MSSHPMQPIALDKDGVARFKSNAIVEWLFDAGKLDLNEIACMDFSKQDRMQIAQLLGYSVSGFGDLSYAKKRVVSKADEIVAALIGDE